MPTKIRGHQVDNSEIALQGDVAAALPVGCEASWTGDPGDIPSGWLECDGSAVSRATYAVLWDKYSEGGTVPGKHGNGDGSTTFNLPDRQGLPLVGAGSQSINGRTKTGPADAYSKQEDQFQGHVMDSPSSGTFAIVIAGSALGTTGASSLTASSVTGSPASDGVNGTPRTGLETRGSRAGTHWIVRVG